MQPKTFKCISTYNCVSYYIIVVSDVKYIHLYCHTTGWLLSKKKILWLSMLMLTLQSKFIAVLMCISRFMNITMPAGED